jgi:excisionase family DNA binding protein
MLDSAGGLVHDPARQIGSSRQIGRAAMPNTHALAVDADAERLFLKATRIARMLDISRAKAYQMMESGELPSVRFGGSRRVPVDAFNAWLEARLRPRPDKKSGERLPLAGAA